MGVQALQGLKFEEVKPLWQQMFECIQICPDPKRLNLVRGLVPDDIEEISTRVMLRKEIVELHVNFSRLVKLSKSQSQSRGPIATGVITRTSPGQLPQ